MMIRNGTKASDRVRALSEELLAIVASVVSGRLFCVFRVFAPEQRILSGREGAA